MSVASDTETTGLLQVRDHHHRRAGISWTLWVVAAVVLLSTFQYRERAQQEANTESTGFPLEGDTIGKQHASKKWHPHVIELAQFKLVDGTPIDSFLQHAERLRSFFVSTNDTIQRSLVLNPETGEWADMVYWSTMSAALKAAKDIMVVPAAQPFLSCIDITTLRLSHSTIQINSWSVPEEKGPVLEIAAFPIVRNVTSQKFVQDADATTPFFEAKTHAKHRLLAQGDDNTTWYDFVYWPSKSEALKAAADIEKDSKCQPFLKAIDSTADNFEFTYSNVQLSQTFQS